MMRAFPLAILVLAVAVSANAQQKKNSHDQREPEPGHPVQSLNLAMGRWIFVSIGSTQLSPFRKRPPYLKFEDPNKTVTGFTGCNRLRGTYRADETTLQLSQVVSTKMACLDDGNPEEKVLSVLNAVTEYKINGQQLQLLGPSGILALLTRPHQEQPTQSSRPEK